ncbi:MAG TPA: hypothetical protein IGS17_13025 [Oscillatoriales cyanobacterium M59_W2019_021]|nr:hypothetical protein [Oscillatoriales cyanobacterium M4454_W2019_049]HIK51827.1 hypothetical protein [Oscillatoriales cyanobacterium M59_W2019_021]
MTVSQVSPVLPTSIEKTLKVANPPIQHDANPSGLQASRGSRYSYFLDPPNLAANAVVTTVEGDIAQLWLGGLDWLSLGQLAEGTAFVGVGGSGRVTLKSHRSWVAEATVEEAVDTGMLLQLEAWRDRSAVLPSVTSDQ